MLIWGSCKNLHTSLTKLLLRLWICYKYLLYIGLLFKIAELQEILSTILTLRHMAYTQIIHLEVYSKYETINNF